MRKRIGFAHPSIRGEHGNAAFVERSANVVRSRHQLAGWQPRRDEMRVLVHCQDRHPVGGLVREAEQVIHLAHRVGERTASGNHGQRDTPAGLEDLRQNVLEVFDPR
jgi:hypothetical protein